MLLRELDEVSQLLHEVGHLLYEVGQLLYADSHHGVWQAGHKSRPSVGKYKNPLIFHPFNIIACNMMHTAHHKHLICVICNSYGHAWVTNSSVC